MRFSREELTTLEKILEYASLEDNISDRLYSKFATIVRRINTDIQNSESGPTARRIRTLPLTKE